MNGSKTFWWVVSIATGLFAIVYTLTVQIQAQANESFTFRLSKVETRADSDHEAIAKMKNNIALICFSLKISDCEK